MVLNVDTWVETEDGTIGLVVDVSGLRRTGGTVKLYVPGEESPREVEADQIKDQFR